MYQIYIMDTSILSSKYQVLIPKEIRRKLDLKPGQCLQLEVRGGHIEMEPILTGEKLVGFLKNTEPLSFERETDRI